MPTILIVEDEPSIRINLETLLAEAGYETLSARDGMEGLAQAEAHQPDLILCDVMMPRMDGMEMLERVRAHPSLASTPFIFLTARSTNDDLREGMTGGADDYLTKPVRARDVFDAIDMRLERFEDIQHEQERRLAALRQSISQVIPHELRTPITAIEGFTSLLHDEWAQLSEEQAHEMLGEILGATQRLKRLVERNALFARLAPQAIDPDQFAGASAARPVLRDAAHTPAAAQDRTADLILRAETARLQIDPDLLRPLVGELVDNALKFSDPGRPVRIHGTRSADTYVVTITDQGRGMDAAQVAAVGAYRQFDRDQHEQQGLGLGIALCQRICDATGCTLSIDSTPDEGTTVQLTIPLADPSPSAMAGTTAQAGALSVSATSR